MVTSVHTPPAAPELYKHNNGTWVVRYPFQTKKGTTVARTYKLGWGEDKAHTAFSTFKTAWGKMNGKGPEFVISQMDKALKRKPMKPNPNAGRALVVAPEKKFKLTAEQRKAARDKYAERKAAGKIVRGQKHPTPQQVAMPQTVAEMSDLVGMMIANANNQSLALKLLQEKLNSMQHNVKLD